MTFFEPFTGVLGIGIMYTKICIYKCSMHANYMYIIPSGKQKTQDFIHFQYMILESIPLSSPGRQRVGLVNHSKADDGKSFMINRKITFSNSTGRIHYLLLCLKTTYPKRGRKPWIRCIQNGCASHHASRAHTKATRLLEKRPSDDHRVVSAA